MEPLIELPEPAKARIKAKVAQAEAESETVRRAIKHELLMSERDWGGYFDLHREDLDDARSAARDHFDQERSDSAQLAFLAHAMEYRLALRNPRELEPVLAKLREALIPEFPESQDTNKMVHNIAPLATVTVSSADESDERLGSGVADGIVDTKEWVTREEMTGAWIKLSWDRPATVTELALYDRPNRFDNVLSGRLTFDDGSVISVPALPPGGTPWRMTFPPKVVHWLTFQIDRAEGKNTGLEEIMVFGTLNP